MYEQYEDYEYKGKERERKLERKRNIMKINSRGLKSDILPLLKKKMDSKPTRVTKRRVKMELFSYG